jgi:site-specific DNA-cytosine methylase
MRHLIVDSFAGGGGASTGIEMALASLRAQGLLPDNASNHVNFAINHDSAALAMHEANHGLTKHLPHDVWKVDMAELVGDDSMGLLWSSPDCFPPGTLVNTPSGLRPIETLIEGDMVLTHKGRYRSIRSTLTRQADTVEVQGYGHFGLVTTPTHQFYSKRITTRYPNAKKENGLRVSAKKELMENPYWPQAASLVGKMWATPCKFPESSMPTCRGVQFSEDFFYLMGRWIGDGSLNKGDVEICCGYAEAQSFSDLIGISPLVSHDGEPIIPRRQKRISTVLFVWACVPLVSWLRENVGDSGHTKRLPVWCLSMQRNWRNALLRGYIDADGHVGRRTRASSVSRELAVGMRLLATSLGHGCSLHRSEGKPGQIEGRSYMGRDLYQIGWTTNAVNETTRTDGRHIFTPVRRVIDAGRQLVVSLEVDEDQSFVADGITVHNCRHHSLAKGGAPVSTSVRDLADVVIKWVGEIAPEKRPLQIYLENVPEFRFWGPTIPDGKGGERRDPSRRGESFQAWIEALRALGYVRIEWRDLRACEYGSPTIRKRLYIIATREDREIVWPAPTHGHPDSEDVRSGRLQPWPVTAQIIDWDRECPSILMGKAQARTYSRRTGRRLIRPLARNTMARIAKGVLRYLLESSSPFIVTCNHSGSEFRGQGLDTPFVTVTRARDAHGIVVPQMIPMAGTGEAAAGSSAAVFMAQHNNHGGSRGGNPGQPVDRPMSTLTGSGSHQSVVAAHMISLKGSDRRSADCAEPHAAICAGGQQSGLVSVPLVNLTGNEGITDPASVLTPAQAKRARLVARFLRQHGCWNEREFVTVGSNVVTDIGMRMLTPRELARAQGFPDDYVLVAPFAGKALSDTEQRHKIGNSVCPQVAAALVAANYRPAIPFAPARMRPVPQFDDVYAQAA